MKKTCLFILACGVWGNLFAQNIKKTDSIFYLLDTIKMPHNDRMWDIGIDGKTKYYTIFCPCLEFNNSPTFVHQIENKGEIINKESFGKLKLISLANLINEAKTRTEKKEQKLVSFFIVEPSKNKYIVHKVGLLVPRKPFSVY